MPGLTYAIYNGASGALKGYLTDDGTATGNSIVAAPEPTFVRKINDGMGTISVRLTKRLWTDWAAGSPPTPVPADGSGGQMLAWFDVVTPIKVDTSEVMGKFIMEGYEYDGQTGEGTLLTLSHVVVDLQDTDCAATANYTTVDKPGAPALGTIDPGSAVTAAIPRTKHCTVGAVDLVGTAYALDFTRAKVRQTLDALVNLGGPNWWWFCDQNGQILAHNTPHITWIPSSANVIWEKEKGSILQAFNVQQMSGATDTSLGGTGLPITTTVTTTGGFWGTSTVGRRVAPPFADPTVASVAALTQIGTSILSRSQTVDATRTVRMLRPGTVIPGDQMYLDAAYWWVTQVTEEGSTGVIEVQLASQFGGYHAAATAGTQFLDNLMTGQPWGTGGYSEFGTDQAVWSGTGIVQTGDSAPYVLRHDATVFDVLVGLDQAAGADMHLQFHAGATLLATFVIPSGSTASGGTLTLSATVTTGTGVTVNVTDPDGVASDMTVQALY